jgi:hypothetical protein
LARFQLRDITLERRVDLEEPAAKWGEYPMEDARNLKKLVKSDGVGAHPTRSALKSKLGRQHRQPEFRKIRPSR